MLRNVIPIVILLLLMTCCKQVRKATDILTQPTAREIYARDFDDIDSLYVLWNSAFAKAYKDTLPKNLRAQNSELPYTAVGIYATTYYKPYRYTFQLSEGETFVAEVETAVDSALVFLDLFTWKNDSIINLKPLQSSNFGQKTLTSNINKSGRYTLIIHPEITTTSSFKVKLYTQPQYRFPVSGKGNKSVQSFWGAPRGGGKRTHKGIDIFAPRGTPVIAITDGRISSTGNRGLGGKQVWLRDGIFGQSLYYAHLDSIIATTGQRVNVGDTLGLVGNTGNAKTTPPHLHFGIYKRTGAINPYPFVKYNALPIITDSLNSAKGILRNTGNLRALPMSKGKKLATLKRKDTVRLLEKTNNWFRVHVNDSVQGFIYNSSIKPI